MSDRLRAYGAVPVEVPTIAVEPPRSPGADGPRDQGPGHRPVRLDRVHLGERGEGRAREVRRARPRRPRVRRRQGRLRRASPPPTPSAPSASSRSWCPPGSSPARACSPTSRPTTTSSTRSTGCCCPAPTSRPRRSPPGSRSAAGRSTTSPPTAPSGRPRRPPPVREAIKGGGFDAVCFTSSSTVRNLVGIAGKPHAKTVVAVIGPATAASAQEFGLRVDVQPETAAVGPLVDALAEFAAAAPGRRRRGQVTSRDAPGLRPRASAPVDARAAAADGADPAVAGGLRAAGVRQGGHRRPGADLARCPASSSTRWTRCGRPRTRRPRPASAG